MKNISELKEIASTYSLLYVEDDIELAQTFITYLSKIFNEVVYAQNGSDGLELYKDNEFELVITDIQMPIMSGMEMSKNILQLHREQKIIVLSAHEESPCLIELINMGVKGFLQKPFEKNKTLNVLFHMCEVLDEQIKNATQVRLNNGFVWHSDSKTLTHEDEAISLCASETSLLDLLISNRNITFSIDDIFNVVYNDYFEKDLSVDSVKSLLKRIRKKVPNNLIKNIYGEGYRINQQLFTA